MLAGALAFLLGGSSARSVIEHPFLAGLSVDFAAVPGGKVEDPCGTAVDSKGDLYVSSRSRAAIYVFGPSGRYLGAVHDREGPCGLATDTKGDLYVSEASRGYVVRYAPHSYPPRMGRLAYGAPVTVDASGRAKGIAVDPYDERLYVADGDRIDVYKFNGALGQNELQRVLVYGATGGTFRLSFEGKETGPLPYDATDAEVEAALAALPTIGRGHVFVKAGVEGARDHYVSFTGPLAARNVEQIHGDPSRLRGGPLLHLYLQTLTQGFSGRIGAGVLKDATAVGAYTYDGAGVNRASSINELERHGFTTLGWDGGAAEAREVAFTFVSHHTASYRGLDRFVFAAEPGSGKVLVFRGNEIRVLRLQETIDGSGTSAGPIGFGRSEPVLGVDSRTGHLYVYDARRAAIEEFEPTGPYVTQIESSSFQGAAPTAIAVDRAGGRQDGAVYVTGAAPGGADLLGFGALLPPRRESLGGFASKTREACGVAMDPGGYLYVAGEAAIRIYAPGGGEVERIADPRRPCNLAVDSAGDIYASELGREPREGEAAHEEVVLYRPNSYPPSGSTRYAGPKTIVPPYEGILRRVAVDPRDNRLFVNTGGVQSSLAEYRSAAEGSGLITESFGAGLLKGLETFHAGIGVCAKNGDVYAAGRGGSGGWKIYVLNPRGTELVTAIDGSGGPRGPFSENTADIGVVRSSCHVLISQPGRPVEEYEASGAFITQFGSSGSSIAVDNAASSPNRGDVYTTSSNGLSVFGPLSYEQR